MPIDQAHQYFSLSHVYLPNNEPPKIRQENMKSRKSDRVYILSNPAFRAGIYKIGITTRSTRVRAWELYEKSSCVTVKFDVEHTSQCDDCELAEKMVHTKLTKHRLNEYREFFEIPLNEAIQIVDDETKAINSQAGEAKGWSLTKNVFLPIVIFLVIFVMATLLIFTKVDTGRITLALRNGLSATKQLLILGIALSFIFGFKRRKWRPFRKGRKRWFR